MTASDSHGSHRFINLSAVRREDQHVVMQEIAHEGHCPFCPEHLAKYHKNPIVSEGRFWLLTENQWPYDKVKQQLLAISKTHVEHLTELDPEAGSELFALFAAEAQKRQIAGGGVALRFGSSPLGNYGSSVKHLHAHLIEPDLAALEPTEAWKFKFGQSKDYRKTS